MNLEDSLKRLRSKMEEANDALRKFDPRSPEEKLRDDLIQALNGLKPFIERAQEELKKPAGEDQPEGDE